MRERGIDVSHGTTGAGPAPVPRSNCSSTASAGPPRRRCSTIHGRSGSPVTTPRPCTGAPTTPMPSAIPERPATGRCRRRTAGANLTSGNGSRALWLLLLPFMVVNLAHWMRPATQGLGRTQRLYGVLVRLVALTLTVLLTAAACEVALDLTAWQCAGSAAVHRGPVLARLPVAGAARLVVAARAAARARRRGARRAGRAAVVPLQPDLERVRVPAPARRRHPGQDALPGSARGPLRGSLAQDPSARTRPAWTRPRRRPYRRGRGTDDPARARPPRVLVRPPTGRPAARRAHRRRIPHRRRRCSPEPPPARTGTPRAPPAPRPGYSADCSRQRSSCCGLVVLGVVCGRGRSERRRDARSTARWSPGCPPPPSPCSASPWSTPAGPGPAGSPPARSPSMSPSGCIALAQLALVVALLVTALALHRRARAPPDRHARPGRPRRRDARLRPRRGDDRRDRPARRRLAGRGRHPGHGRRGRSWARRYC